MGSHLLHLKVQFIKNRCLRLMFLAIIVILLVSLERTYKWQMETQRTIRCFHKDQPEVEHLIKHRLSALGDVLLTEPRPTPGRSIFFLETSCPLDPHLLQLTARQACAIESAALHNPNFQVFVLFASPRNQPQDESKEPLIDAILSYPNVQLRRLNLMRYAEGTPIEDWLKDGQLFRSSYLISHMSDLLRLITLFRFGGIYLDMDVVVLRSLEHVPLNYAGAESDTHVANGVMSLAPTGFGHLLAESCLHDFLINFDGGDWGNNGPGVITRVAQTICGTKNITMMLEDRKRCHGFRVFDRNAFYAIKSRDWRHFFEPDFVEETLERTRDSYLLHVWNRNSYRTPIKVGSSSAYAKIAQLHCPRAFKAAGEYF
ncbi:hypothetical protein ACLKA6_012062 [Drosophila palustris]